MKLRVLLLLSLWLVPLANAQNAKHEFRGAWVASVANLDWPSCNGCSSSVQQTQLVQIMDGLKEAGVNAVVFQVRTESDALYDSPYEPWSYWLTGEQGTAPDPFFDPLELAVDLAHERGMELHAWINPYRADRGSSYPKADNHVTNTHPEWILSYPSGIKILDPGIPDVRDHVTGVIGDILRRYDVDGIHYDDYFYPYEGSTNEDDATFATYNRGFTNRGDWRRDNINLLIEQVQDTVQTVRPEAAHGVSPFGIWKNGIPSGTSGLDAYNVIYADAVAWLQAQDIDYLAPQLYWSSQRSFDADGDGDLDFNRQRFTTLAPWWASVRNGRHIYPGVAAYRAGQPGFEPEEIPTQLRYVREHADLDGTIVFRARSGILFGGYGLADSLESDLYRHPALTPTMEWKNMDAPGAPGTLSETWNGDDLTLTWSAPTDGDAEARRYAVYRIPSPSAPTFPDALENPEHLIAVTGETQIVDRPYMASSPWTYVVTAVSANSIESPVSNTVVVNGRAVSAEERPSGVLALMPPRPNPTTGQSEIEFTLTAPLAVSVRVYDVLGREVATLLDGEAAPAGTQTLVWDGHTASGPAPTGTYLVVLEADGERRMERVTILR